MRRSGKSTLLKQFRSTLNEEDNIISINESHIERIRDWKELKKAIREEIVDNKINYVFIDEIQNVSGWERVVAELVARGDCDIYITGSNSGILSSELSTKISGRYVKIRIAPLSFEEYLALHPGDTEGRFREYMEFGLLPTVDPERGKEPCNIQLEDTFNSILIKDVMGHMGRSDVSKMISLARYVYTNIGEVTNIDTIAKRLKIGYPTVQRYVEEMILAHLVSYCEFYDIEGERTIKSKGKFYAEYIGMRRVLMTGADGPDIDSTLENMVYMELKHRFPVVRTGRIGGMEVDFVVSNHDVTEYYQVCTTVMSKDIKNRKFQPYDKIRDNYRKIILTMDRFGLGSYDGIEVINMTDWLLDRVR